MDRLKIERRGGLTGLPARGEIALAKLSKADSSALAELFKKKGKLPPAPGADRFTYKVTWLSASGQKTLDIPEHLLPASIAEAVKEELP